MKHPIWTVLGTIVAILALLFAIFIWFVPSPKTILAGGGTIATNTADTTTSIPTNTLTPTNIPITNTSIPTNNPSLHSGSGGTSTYITFRNTSTEIVSIYWVDSQGNEQLYTSLGPDRYYQPLTYIGNIWRIKDSNGKVLKEIRVTGPFQLVII